MKHRLLRTILAMLGITLVGGLAFIMLYPVYKPVPAPNFPKPKDQAEANRQDLTYFRLLGQMDRSFTTTTRAAFYQEVDNLLAQADTLDRAALEMAVTRAAALANNGHTVAHGVAYGHNLNAIPLRFAWFQEGLFIVKAEPAHEDLLGAKVVTLGGQPPTALVPALRPYSSGTDEFAHAFMPYLLSSPPALHAIGLLPSPAEVQLTLQLRDGSTVDRTISSGAQPAVPAGERRQPKYDLSPVSRPADGWEWAHVLDGLAELPPYLRHLDRQYWWMQLEDPALLYVQINAVTDGVGLPPLDAFLREVLDAVAAQQPRYVAVDLRFNSGGNYERTVHFTEALPKLLPGDGKVFILTSNTTFSAAIVTLARLKYFAGTRAEIVGEQIGDRPQQWGEGGAFTLPNSGITIRYATGYHDWENGCSWRDWRRCFWLNYLYGVPAGDLSPTIPAPLTFADYMAGADSGLKAIEQAILTDALLPALVKFSKPHHNHANQGKPS